ncbi:hypothetical protein COCOBI_14-4240 [Coccomyxa sp. Obi]|nr:hypothetical protein COCOBI_14-4240 [Coccomyxa sp. Obi]
MTCVRRRSLEGSTDKHQGCVSPPFQIPRHSLGLISSWNTSRSTRSRHARTNAHEYTSPFSPLFKKHKV